jgi:hypothetical protein
MPTGGSGEMAVILLVSSEQAFAYFVRSSVSQIREVIGSLTGC